MSRALMVACLCLWSARLTSADDWPQFRGPKGDGSLASVRHPLEWSADQNVAWKAVVPGSGWSSPIVVGGRVFVTSAVSEGELKPKNMQEGARDARSLPIPGFVKPLDVMLRYQVHCLDLATGEITWSRVVVEDKPKIAIHPSNTFATESPAADEERVYAFFGTVGVLAAFDWSGNLVWEKRLDVYPVTFGFGTGSSLALADGRLFLQRDNDEKSSLTAFDAKTGQEIWKVDRESKTSWSTPFVWKNRSRTELIACGSGSVLSQDPATGEEIWRLERITSSFSASPTANEDYVFFGSSGPLSSSPLYAVKAGAVGNITLERGKKSNEYVAWYRTGSGPGMASPVVYGDLLYVPAEGILKVFEVATGEPVYRQRVPGAKIFVASPWAADGKIFFLDEEGKTFVLKAGRTFELLGTNTIADTFWSSPAIAGPEVLLRGVHGLYCIRNERATAAK